MAVQVRLARFFPYRLSLFGRALLLLSLELLANAALWIVAGILFAGKHAVGRGDSGDEDRDDADRRSLLSLAVLAWTLGLRHALDADHISAIDNATRGLIAQGQKPVTCGLFFSLGHSTIVIVVIVSIAVSTDVYDRFLDFGDVGGIIGASVSSAFLFLLAIANSVVLYRIVKRKRRLERQEQERQTLAAAASASATATATPKGKATDADVDIEAEVQEVEPEEKTVMMRLLGRVTTFVDRPWKMYPVGVLFGLGFDTASSIALLAISALARGGVPSSHVVILPLLFTAGMTLVDSIDSVLMVYAYSSTGTITYDDDLTEKQPNTGKWWSVIERVQKPTTDNNDTNDNNDNNYIDNDNDSINKLSISPDVPEVPALPSSSNAPPNVNKSNPPALIPSVAPLAMQSMSSLSIALTLISILVAASIALITLMGLIGEVCNRCSDAAERQREKEQTGQGDGGGLEGRWWLFWAKVNDQSGYIGAAIVGSFVLVVAGWYGIAWLRRSAKRKQKITN